MSFSPNEKHFDIVQIETERFYLRTLKQEDATLKYVLWFEDPIIKSYISAANSPHSICELKNFIQEKNQKNDALLLGIFTKKNPTHIGNIKYEPIDINAQVATMGILIGEGCWRGLGVASEVILATAKWLNMNYSISKFNLGVKKSNTRAITAYNKSGFVINTADIKNHNDNDNDSVTMCLNL